MMGHLLESLPQLENNICWPERLCIATVLCNNAVFVFIKIISFCDFGYRTWPHFNLDISFRLIVQLCIGLKQRFKVENKHRFKI